ncbi:Glutathione transport system permease protein GsiD [Calidithermus terrae]|uniref:Glutathione transport system permease protein GsiD n=1 Tax=Calidithermus terrae TaxID=1408545 RepID=A0A399ELJ9_9DEIN|nr:ABC transporter permease [Calidithermus terrae]RIH84838.1 Glutathione transport system permease protein GsiD [Calidithermus terrae]
MAATATAPSRVETPTRMALKRFMKSTSGKIGLVMATFLVLVALLAPVFRPYNPATDRDFLNIKKPPSAERLFGTDNLGRDVFTRVIHGSRISLQVGLIAVGLSLTIGTLLGLMAGYFRGGLEVFIGWITDILLAFPSTLLAIAIVAVLGSNLTNAMIAVSVTQIPIYIRLARSVALSVRELEFIQAATALGAPNRRILLRHLLPNALPPVIVQATLSIGTATLETAALGFLGLGAQPPAPEWGAMLSDAFRQGHWLDAPWMMVFPGFFILLTVLAFNLLGDGLRDALDPRANK